jgi:hypothetical protein
MAVTLATKRIEVALLAAMASLALSLSAVGIFAPVANIVAEGRARSASHCSRFDDSEGDDPHRPIRSRRCHSWIGCGLVLSADMLRAMRNVLYGVDVYDAPTLVLILSVVTLLATTAPALRVARIDPAKTLREE